MLKAILKAIEVGSQRDLLCYDEYAREGEFTRRLLVLMKYIAIEKDHSLPPLAFLHVSKMAYREIFCWSHNPIFDTISKSSFAIKDEHEYYISIMGIDIVLCPDLDSIWEPSQSGFGHVQSHGNIMHVFTENGYCLQYHDIELVIGVSADYTNVILGSF